MKEKVKIGVGRPLIKVSYLLSLKNFGKSNMLYSAKKFNKFLCVSKQVTRRYLGIIGKKIQKTVKNPFFDYFSTIYFTTTIYYLLYNIQYIQNIQKNTIICETFDKVWTNYFVNLQKSVKLLCSWRVCYGR